MVLYYLASAESSITIKRTADADFPNGLDFLLLESYGVKWKMFKGTLAVLSWKGGKSDGRSHDARAGGENNYKISK